MVQTSEMGFSIDNKSRDIYSTTWKLREGIEHRTVNSSCKFQRQVLKGVEMPDVKQSHLSRFRFGMRFSDTHKSRDFPCLPISLGKLVDHRPNKQPAKFQC